MMGPDDNSRLSRLLFAAREEIDMWADIIEAKTGEKADPQRRIVREIDEYRAERGWSPNGYGGEQ